ncbi:zinc finger domain-containing protein [Trichocoleus sp. FACHB-90]|uniref:zinc finger domain-containing protein n=2 Tax=Cyanophyceae TaxID=3028117 RepID=UPI0016863980|nr:zinc finger domain-containing protein [Trichocoleus sp. FACHB-90]
MKACPECNGSGQRHIAAVPGVHQQYDMECPTCDGTGRLPDPDKFPNNCPACGEPIMAGEERCRVHKQTEKFNSPELN